VFTSLVVVTASSILYVNFLNVIWWHYEFSVAAMIMVMVLVTTRKKITSKCLQGLVIIISYVVRSETEFMYLFRGRLKAKQKDGFFGVESTGSPLNCKYKLKRK
jgi:hypothetical protein